MSHEAARSVRHSHRERLGSLVAPLALVAFALLLTSGCAALGTKSAGSPTVCADKVVQSITTNAKVDGLYACLSKDFQNKIENYVAAGLLHSNDDAVFTDGTSAKPPIIGTHLIGLANGVAAYAVIVQTSQSGEQTITLSIWLKPAPKVDNLAISGPLF